jgi:hypothetical protein
MDMKKCLLDSAVIAIVLSSGMDTASPARRSNMLREIDLRVGEVLQIGNQCLIIVETQDDEVTLKICNADDLTDALSDWCGPPKK